MDRPDKCKNCQWYGKPYWSIINPCDNCPMENVETFTHWIDPNIKELKEENERLKKELDNVNMTIRDYVKLINRVGDLEEENNRLKEGLEHAQQFFNENFYDMLDHNCDKLNNLFARALKGGKDQ